MLLTDNFDGCLVLGRTKAAVLVAKVSETDDVALPFAWKWADAGYVESNNSSNVVVVGTFAFMVVGGVVEWPCGQNFLIE